MAVPRWRNASRRECGPGSKWMRIYGAEKLNDRHERTNNSEVEQLTFVSFLIGFQGQQNHSGRGTHCRSTSDKAFESDSGSPRIW